MSRNSWIKISDRHPELNESVLVAAKSGYNYSKDPEKDSRTINIYVGHFEKEYSTKIEFIVDCGCYGYGHEREEFEVLCWRSLTDLTLELDL